MKSNSHLTKSSSFIPLFPTPQFSIKNNLSTENMSSHYHTAMAADSTSLAEVGTRGTIGFLVSQEIEYFRNHETHQQKSSHKSRNETKDTAFSSIGSGNKKKKSNKAVGGGFLPSICSAVEISNAGGGAGYMNLRTDCEKLMQD